MYERRLLRLFFGVAAVLVVILARAFYVQVVAADDLVKKQEGVLRSLRIVYPRRGEILWADGSLAVRNTSRCVVRLDARQFFATRSACRACGAVATQLYETPDPKKERQGAAALPPACRECGAPGPGEPLPGPDVAALARILGIDGDVAGMQRALAAARSTYDAWKWRSVDLLPGRKLPRETALALASRAAEFPGIEVRTEPYREADPEIAALAGRADAALDTDVAELTSPKREEQGLRRYEKDEVLRLLVGRSGFERVRDEQFRGVPGVVERLPSGPGDEGPREAVIRQVVDGVPLRTTLVRDLQRVANEIVEAPGGRSKSAVVLDLAQDGAVVAIASRSDDAYFHAILGIVPGSVFKLVTALAMLEGGIDPDATLDCDHQGFLRPGVHYRCLGRHPGADLRRAFAVSCNYYFMRRAEDAGADRMADAYARLGFDVKPRLGVGYATNLGGIADFRENLVQLGIGQAHALASPVQVATAYARLATRGRRIVPYLDRDAGPAPESREVDPEIARHADLLIEAARSVVVEGTGSKVAGLVALEAAGKSGTAQVAVSRTTRSDHAWFVGFAPASSPRYVAVVVHEFADKGGSTVAGPDVARLLEAALRER